MEEELSKKEKNKLYQKEYYEQNKEKLIKNACQKVKCLHCGRTVIRNNIKKHQLTRICMKNRDENKTYELIS